MALALLALLLAAEPAPAAAPAPALAPLLERADAAWKVRDQAGRTEEADAALDEAARLAPDDYDVLWRQARLLFWKADDPSVPKEEKSRLGKAAWEKGDRAAALRPDRVEGWFYAAAGVGNYALGIGVVTALLQGIEPKYKERLTKAESIDPAYDSGAISTAWGRFWYELPWPKYSAKRSRKALEDALRLNPDNVRAYVYLADLNLKEDEPKYAREDLQKALAKPPGQYDAPEERRWQAVARKKLASL